MATKTETKTTKAPKLCLCACGETTTNLFRQGHDARAKGQMLRHMAEHKGTLVGFANKALAKYATEAEAGAKPAFGGRFLGIATVGTPRTRKAKQEAAA